MAALLDCMTTFRQQLEETERRRSGDRCWNCGQLGHWTVHCLKGHYQEERPEPARPEPARPDPTRADPTWLKPAPTPIQTTDKPSPACAPCPSSSLCFQRSTQTKQTPTGPTGQSRPVLLSVGKRPRPTVAASADCRASRRVSQTRGKEEQRPAPPREAWTGRGDGPQPALSDRDTGCHHLTSNKSKVQWPTLGTQTRIAQRDIGKHYRLPRLDKTSQRCKGRSINSAGNLELEAGAPVVKSAAPVPVGTVQDNTPAAPAKGASARKSTAPVTVGKDTLQADAPTAPTRAPTKTSEETVPVPRNAVCSSAPITRRSRVSDTRGVVPVLMNRKPVRTSAPVVKGTPVTRSLVHVPETVRASKSVAQVEREDRMDGGDTPRAEDMEGVKLQKKATVLLGAPYSRAARAGPKPTSTRAPERLTGMNHKTVNEEGTDGAVVPERSERDTGKPSHSGTSPSDVRLEGDCKSASETGPCWAGSPRDNDALPSLPCSPPSAGTSGEDSINEARWNSDANSLVHTVPSLTRKHDNARRRSPAVPDSASQPTTQELTGLQSMPPGDSRSGFEVPVPPPPHYGSPR